MTSEKDIERRIEFTEHLAEFEEKLFDLCNSTSEATDEPPPNDELVKLIGEAEQHIAEYQKLVAENSGGRLEAVKESERFIKSLGKFTAELRKIESRQKS